jgi:hypothetical protein
MNEQMLFIEVARLTPRSSERGYSRTLFRDNYRNATRLTLSLNERIDEYPQKHNSRSSDGAYE